MPNGGLLRIEVSAVTISAGHRSNLPPGDYVRLSVSDTGIGMNQATLIRAIEPFFSTKGIGQGTGLGLSMVHGLSQQLGGALTLESREGLGTTAELWLCAAPIATPVILPNDSGNKAVATGTALLVDDEELVRASTADMLTDLGYSVIEASSAEAAMQMIDNGVKFDVLVTDHLMPGMNGTDLAEAARGRYPTLPVLIVSGYSEHSGLAAHLPRLAKPFRSSDLAAAIAAIRRIDIIEPCPPFAGGGKQTKAARRSLGRQPR
jgi:CheY-like chemotaxis protein